MVLNDIQNPQRLSVLYRVQRNIAVHKDQILADQSKLAGLIEQVVYVEDVRIIISSITFQTNVEVQRVASVNENFSFGYFTYRPIY